jgi:hypothetical protein
MKEQEKESDLDIVEEVSKAPASFTVAAIAAAVIIIPATLWWGYKKINPSKKEENDG